LQDRKLLGHLYKCHKDVHVRVIQEMKIRKEIFDGTK
jgi:hypothetical protein